VERGNGDSELGRGYARAPNLGKVVALTPQKKKAIPESWLNLNWSGKRGLDTRDPEPASGQMLYSN